MRIFSPHLIVRNPRNLERLCIAAKPKGYQYEKDRETRSFYYKVDLELSSKHTTGLIRHLHDGVVISASTTEWPIAKRLYRCDDVSAALNIGRILARRCLQAGIYFAKKNVSPEEIERSEKVKIFYEALVKEGLRLDEPEALTPKYETDKRYHWEFDEVKRDKNTPT